MSEEKMGKELERRLDLLEDPASDEHALDDMPVRDIVMAVLGLAVMTVVLLIWGYPA